MINLVRANNYKNYINPIFFQAKILEKVGSPSSAIIFL
jgi:hypothetical protein